MSVDTPKFPRSYRLFAQRYGWGRTLGNFLIYLPADAACDSWQQMREAVKSAYLDDLADYADYYPDDIVQLMARTEPFARSESGFFLFWDTASGAGRDEFDIYATDFVGGFHLLGSDLPEMFRNLTRHGSVLQACFNREPFPNTFEGFDGIA